MYDYWWGLTAQEVQLMAIDQPIVVYDHKKDKKKSGKPEFKKPTDAAMRKAQLQWEKMKAEKREKEKALKEVGNDAVKEGEAEPHAT